jgi:hypothetical protein
MPKRSGFAVFGPALAMDENHPKEEVGVPKNGTGTEEAKLDKTRRLGRRASRSKSQSAIGKN